MISDQDHDYHSATSLASSFVSVIRRTQEAIDFKPWGEIFSKSDCIYRLQTLGRDERYQHLWFTIDTPIVIAH